MLGTPCKRLSWAATTLFSYIHDPPSRRLLRYTDRIEQLYILRNSIFAFKTPDAYEKLSPWRKTAVLPIADCVIRRITRFRGPGSPLGSPPSYSTVQRLTLKKHSRGEPGDEARAAVATRRRRNASPAMAASPIPALLALMLLSLVTRGELHHFNRVRIIVSLHELGFPGDNEKSYNNNFIITELWSSLEVKNISLYRKLHVTLHTLANCETYERGTLLQ